MIIEVKDHQSNHIRFDSQHVKVYYGKNDYWSDATEQLRRQRYSLINFLRRNNQPQPWIGTFIWLRNYNSPIPQSAADVLGANPTTSDFLRILERIKTPRRDGDDFYIAFSKNEDVNSIRSTAAFFRPNITRTKLDRRRLEHICKKLISEQKYVDRLGQQLLVFRGRGGSGKTVHLLRLAKDLYDNGNRIILLTFNKALVADIRRLLVILGMNNDGFDARIQITTVHKFFRQMLLSWGLWRNATVDIDLFPVKEYEEGKGELLQLLSDETPESLLDEPNVKNSPEVFAWDYVLVDEGQDWPADERDILYKIFGPHHCIVADGIDQLTRGNSLCEWTGPLIARNRQVVPLRRALRMKSNLCRFIRSFADEAGVEWDQEINEEISGGCVTIIEGPYSLEHHNLVFKAHREQGNEPIDALFCVPPDTSVVSPVLTERLKKWGLSLWDGTSRDVRETFPTKTEEYRVVHYESCRGLEGWTVVCVGLDKFFENKFRHSNSDRTPSLFESSDGFRHRQATAWTLIPLTRAIDHLVIQIDGPGIILNICKKLSTMHPDFIDWRVGI